MITYNDKNKTWRLETQNTAYVFGFNDAQSLNHIYYGTKLIAESDYPGAPDYLYYPFSNSEGLHQEEYMAWSKAKYTEPCIKATFHDNVRDVVLVFDQYSINDNTLEITLKDAYYDFEVKLLYSVIYDCDLIIKSIQVANYSDKPIIIEQILSGTLFPPKGEDYRLTHLNGKWAQETQLQQAKIPNARIVLESRTGTTSHNANPFFMLDYKGEANEDYGKVYYGALAFSGNWKITIEKDSCNTVKVCAGINDFDFLWNLEPGTDFKSPDFVIGFTNQGFGQASRNLHKYQLEYVLPKEHRKELRKVLYNSWEATAFDVNGKQQCALADVASDLGIELFVMDDGWFSTRNDDHSGLGDWYVSKDKFPNGLEALIEYVNGKGMDFGIWIEPEMVNRDSDLYRQHPDWIYHFPNRESTELRNQYVLNLSRKDVRDYIYEVMDHLLTHYNITYIKWDMNRNFTEPGFPSENPAKQREIWVRHVQALYDIAKSLRKKHPTVVFQTCSGGGGRVDLGILRYFDQAWTSDNTDAFDRLSIQEGFSYAYCAKIMECWVTSETAELTNRKLPLEYRFHSAMMGNLGIGDNILKWTQEERTIAKSMIQAYKEIREIIQHGDYYRISSARNSSISSAIYVSKDQSEAVLFAFLQKNMFENEYTRILLKGLEPGFLYEIENYGVLSGKALMNIGIMPKFKSDYSSILIRINSIKDSDEHTSAK